MLCHPKNCFWASFYHDFAKAFLRLWDFLSYVRTGYQFNDSLRFLPERVEVCLRNPCCTSQTQCPLGLRHFCCIMLKNVTIKNQNINLQKYEILQYMHLVKPYKILSWDRIMKFKWKQVVLFFMVLYEDSFSY